MKFKVLGGATGYAGDAAEAVGLARIMMRYILGKLKNGPMGLTVDQLQMLDYYFRLGGAPMTGTEVDIMRQTLTATSTGLFSADLNLKISGGGGSTVGYVNKHDERFGLKEKLQKKLGGKSRWTPGLDHRANHNTHRGDIHLSDSALDRGPEYAAMTLIHEGTHKFASTGDYGYTYSSLDFLYDDNPPTRAQAINNADSYSTFVMMAYLFPNG